MPLITGGETVKTVLQVSDQDMQDIQALQRAGIGIPGHGVSDDALAAILSIRRGVKETRSQRYERFAEAMSATRLSTDSRIIALRAQASAAYWRTVRAESPSVGQVHSDQTIAEMSTQYGNDEFIGEGLMPPVLVKLKSGEFKTYNKADRFQSPADDRIAEDGDVAEIVEGRGTDTYSCQDRGFQNKIAANTIAAQDAPLDELFDLTEALLDHRELAREVRIATVLTTAANYLAANRRTLAGADQWNAAGGGNPIEVMQTGDAALYRGRSPAVTRAASSLEIYNVLSRHEDILGLFQYSGTAVGLATPTMIAKFLGWDDYFVGRARRITSVEGDADVYARIWGDFFVILRVAMRQTIRSATFGLSFRWTMPGVPGANGGLLTQQWFDMRKGLGGMHFAKAGDSEDHKVQANDAGYILSDVLA